MNAPEIPLPKDPRHQRYADGILSGLDGWEAYQRAYTLGKKKPAKASCHTGHKRLKGKPDVIAYLRAIRQQSAGTTLLSVNEKREFFARIVRTPITSLSHEREENADLIKSYSVNESETSSNVRLEKLDPLKAIELDNKLAGEDPETNLLSQLAQALTSIGNQSSKMEVT